MILYGSIFRWLCTVLCNDKKCQANLILFVIKSNLICIQFISNIHIYNYIIIILFVILFMCTVIIKQ